MERCGKGGWPLQPDAMRRESTPHLTKPHGERYSWSVTNKNNPNFLNGVPELLVLTLLARREMYGYEIVKAIQSETKEILRFGEGCIYPYLHYLEKKKLVNC